MSAYTSFLSLWRDNMLAVGLALAMLAGVIAILHLQERFVARFAIRRFGWRAVLLTGWIGVPLHELSHVLAVKIFRHRLVDWRLLAPDPETGTLGYVRHAHARATAWQLLGYVAIGLAPLVAGAVALWLLLWWMVAPLGLRALLAALFGELHGYPALSWTVLGEVLRSTASRTGTLIEAIWSGRSAVLPLQLYLAASVACHLAPSLADLRGAGRGFLLLGLFLMLVTVTSAALKVSLLGLTLMPAPLLLVMLLLVAAFQGVYIVLLAAAHAIWSAVHP